MLLSAALPQHGPTPNPQQKKKMEEAGPLIYDAYNLFQSGSQNVEAAGEQLKLGLHTESASSNLASGKMLMPWRAAQRLSSAHSRRPLGL